MGHMHVLWFVQVSVLPIFQRKARCAQVCGQENAKKTEEWKELFQRIINYLL